MTQQVEQKLTINQIDRIYVSKLKENELEFTKAGEKYQTKKNEIIRAYAKDLKSSGKIETNKICAHLIEELGEFIDPSYISRSLDNEFKNKEQSSIAKKGAVTKKQKSKKKAEVEDDDEQEDQDDETEEEIKDHVKGRENINRKQPSIKRYLDSFIADNVKGIDPKKISEYSKPVLEQIASHLIAMLEHLEAENEQLLIDREGLLSTIETRDKEIAKLRERKK